MPKNLPLRTRLKRMSQEKLRFLFDQCKKCEDELVNEHMEKLKKCNTQKQIDLMQIHYDHKTKPYIETMNLINEILEDK